MSKELWSEKVGPHGATVTVGERVRGGNVYLWSWDPELGGQRKHSLKFKVRDTDEKLIRESVQKAKAEAADLSNKLIKGERPGERDQPLTLGELFDRFRRDVVEQEDWSDKHEADVTRGLELWETHLGRSFKVVKFGLREWNDLRNARHTGEVDARGNRVRDPKGRRPRNPWTAGNDLKILRAACRHAMGVRTERGSYLLDVDPTRGLEIPTNPDPKRPVADDEIVASLLNVAGNVKVRHGHGKDATYHRAPFREILILAVYTGRRLSAVLGLRWSDWKPDVGTYGALRWRADTDKLRRERVVPVHPEVRGALEVWRQDQPGIGDAWIFPAPASDGPVRADVAERWLRDAMDSAGLGWPVRFGYHAFRRMWATKRKDLPVQDVAAAGGWKGTQVLREIYQQADPETMEAVVMGGRDLLMAADGD